MNKPDLTIVIPCFNEEEVLPETHNRMLGLVKTLMNKGKISSGSRILLVDDGSSDATWQIIKELSVSSEHISGLKLSRNRGHQVALLAGLHAAEGDVVVSIDADLQDDIAIIETMLDKYKEGCEVVYGVRNDRTSDSFFKRTTAELYYKLLSTMGVEIIYNHADYRLLSRRALDALKAHEEVNLFLRGIVPTLGFRSCQVTYERTERFAGESKYPLKKMLALAIDGITSFSALPLRFIAGLGVLVFLVSLLISCWALWVRLFSDNAVPGWASSVLPMYLLGGIQLLSLGVVGEYVAKIYAETKRRPKYFVEETT